MKIHLVELNSNIYEDSYEEGELEYTGCGYSGEKIGETFDSIEAAAEWLNQNYSFPTDYEDDEDEQVIWSDQLVTNHSDEQNGGWFKATDEEIEEWKRGELTLYNERMRIKYIRVCDHQ